MGRECSIGIEAGFNIADIRLNRQTLKPGMGRTLAHRLKVTLGGFNVALQYANLVALLVQLKHVFFLPFNRFQQFFFLVFTHLIGSTDAIVDVLYFAGQSVSK